MFEGASNLAAGVDRAFVFIFAIAAFFIIGITAFMIWTVFRFNRKKGKPDRQFTGSTTLEIIWTVVPLVIVMAMFYYGWVAFAPMRKVPADAMTITAIGKMWQWEFDYGNGKISKEMVVPKDKPVRVDLYSPDVNHSFFIPAFRVKEDVVPGYQNYVWFSAYKVGEYDILCTEYCGLMHSSMVATARVVPEEEFRAWLDSLPATGNLPDPEGLTLLKNTGCIACHSLDGTKLVGPSFKGFYGKKHVVIEDGAEKEIEVNDEYIHTSIVDPNKQVVKGFGKGLMQSYKTILTEDQIKQMTDYLKTLKE